MNPCEKLIRDISLIEREIQNKSIDIAAGKGSYIAKLQVQQTDQSLNASGKLIKPPYRPATRQRKLRAGRSGNVDLRDKGNFLSEVTTVVFNNKIHIVSFDEKSKFLVPKYDPFGLMEENMDKLRIAVLPELGKWVKNTIGV